LALSTYTQLQERGRGDHAGGDAEEEEGRGVRLQGVPLGVGTATATAIGRQHSRNIGENPRLHLRPHQQQDARPGFESFYPGVGMRAGAGEAADRECSMALGRQRSHSAGEGTRSRMYPKPTPSH
jgi:hypothetical protein